MKYSKKGGRRGERRSYKKINSPTRHLPADPLLNMTL